jgi:membrane carboxypeptidase/penicillin-binding protein
VLQQNAQYGTGAGSGDGVHPNAGKTGTTENHADAWFDGYTRQLSTVVWMGYPKGEIPMLNVHGQAVAGATFPVPIWHEYMAAALWHHKVLGFMLPDRYPTWRSITRGSYGSFGSYYTPTYSTPTTPTTTTTAHTPTPAAKPKPAPARTTAPRAKPTPKPTPAPAPAPTTTAPAPPPTTTAPPPPETTTPAAAP